MNTVKAKILWVSLLVMSGAAVALQSGCEKQQGPEHKVAMTASELDEKSSVNEKPMLKKLQASEDTTTNDAEGPKPVAVDPAPPAGNDPVPLTEISTPADDVRYYRIKADDTYWKIAARELGNPQRWREIKSLNPDVNPNALKIGQSIRIPVR